jgi:hypothetical protein
MLKKKSFLSWLCENSFRTLFSEVYKVTLQVSFVFVVICVLFLLVSLLLPKDNDNDFNINYLYEFLPTSLQTPVTWGERTTMFYIYIYIYIVDGYEQKYPSDV